MKIIKYSIAILILISFYSCDSNDEELNQDTSGLIKSITTNISNLSVDYSYNTDAKIKEKIVSNGNNQFEVNYTYQDAKISLDKTTYNGSVVAQNQYSYSNERLDRFTIVGVSQSYWQLHYDNNNHVDYAIEYISGAVSIKHEFTYANNSVIEAVAYNRFGNSWEMTSRFEFEYDTKNNPIYELELPFSETLDEFANFVSPNNVTRSKEYDENNILINDIHYQITYNSTDFPLEVVEGADTYNFTYY